MTLSRPSTTLSPNRSDPSCARIVFLSPMCTHRPISSSDSSGVAWISTPLPRNNIPRVMMCGLASLNFSNRQYRTRYHGVYARLASAHFSEAIVRNLACLGSRSRCPRQRRWSGAFHMLVMAGKPIGGATRYPHLYSIAAHAERPRKDLETRGACPTSPAWASALVVCRAGGGARGWARRLRQHRLVGRRVARAGLAGAGQRRRQQQLHRDRRRRQAVAAVDA